MSVSNKLLDGLTNSLRTFEAALCRLLLAVLLVISLLCSPGMAQDPEVAYQKTLQIIAQRLLTKLSAARVSSGMVLDFTDLQSQPSELGRLLSQELADQLVAADSNITFIDRTNIQLLLKENRMSAEGLVDSQTARKLGKLVGIDTAIVGTIVLTANQVRLSVRAVALETGRIIAAQSARFSVPQNLADLINRGVADNALESEASGKLKTRIRPESLKLSVRELYIPNSPADSFAKLPIAIKNMSGIGLGIALKTGGTTAGPCKDEFRIAGLKWVDEHSLRSLKHKPNPASDLQWLPAGGSISAMIELGFPCGPSMLQGWGTVPVSVILVVATDNELLELPLYNEKVPVRIRY